jgi:hypothetical protein
VPYDQKPKSRPRAELDAWTAQRFAASYSSNWGPKSDRSSSRLSSAQDRQRVQAHNAMRAIARQAGCESKPDRDPFAKRSSVAASAWRTAEEGPGSARGARACGNWKGARVCGIVNAFVCSSRALACLGGPRARHYTWRMQRAHRSPDPRFDAAQGALTGEVVCSWRWNRVGILGQYILIGSAAIRPP